MPDVIVVGAGHNGLVAACYLARAGASVLVLEAQARPGGGSRTEETIPGFGFDLHSVAHNMINMTDIPRELELAEAGLEYLEMDPFSASIQLDGQAIRFHRSVDATVESAEGSLRVVEEHTPGFMATIRDVAVHTPDVMEAEERWPGRAPDAPRHHTRPARAAPPHPQARPAPHTSGRAVHLWRGHEPVRGHRGDTRPDGGASRGAGARPPFPRPPTSLVTRSLPGGNRPGVSTLSRVDTGKHDV